MTIGKNLARVVRRAGASEPSVDRNGKEETSRPRYRVWHFAVAALALTAVILLTFKVSVWNTFLVAILLACPAVAVWGYFTGVRPLPIPLGPIPVTRGMTLNWMAPWYDSLWCPLFGLGQRFRARTFALAALRQGDSVLDVGCGTGWLTRRAALVIGPSGAAWGIDPAPDMIRLAMQMGSKPGNAAAFKLAAVEALPFEDASFDVVVASLVIHHLPPDLKLIGLREIYRVLGPGGRLVVVEPDRPDHWLWRILLWPARFHPNLRDHLDGRTSDLLRSAGFVSVTVHGHWAHWITFWTARKP